jgi:mevalonate kinase
MPAVASSAPGKIILFGEHAVVYGRPAIAIPVFEVSSKCTVVAQPQTSQNRVEIIAPSINLKCNLSALNPQNFIRKTTNLVLETLNIDHIPSCEIRIQSTIPVGGGLGSSASVTISIARALSIFLGHPLNDVQINSIAFEVEKLHHGTPSGIDNTVITYGKPVYFIKGSPIETLHLEYELTFIIADSGIKASTAKAVKTVRDNWKNDQDKFNDYFERIGKISIDAKQNLEQGNCIPLGQLMNQNHALLQDLNVSNPELDHLVHAAVEGGALGAKLSGGGMGGNMIALVNADEAEQIAETLMKAGAVRTIIDRIPTARISLHE